MPARNFTDAEEEQIAKIYLAGHSARAIARAYGLGHHISIVAALRRQGVEQRSPSERNRLYALNPTVFDSIDNELAAYWLGFLYADGCVSRRTLICDLKISDGDHLQHLRQFMESESPIHKRRRQLSHNAHIEFTDQHLTDRLRQLGITTGRPYPQRMVDSVPERLVHHCIRGYFDGDGSARKSKSLAFCGDKALLLWLRRTFAVRAGTNPNLAVSKHKTAAIHYLYISGRKQALKVAAFMYRDATVWLGRKRQVIDSWPAPQPR